MDDIHPERERQFDLIEKATAITLQWALDHSIPLKHIEPVVPFIETVFSLEAWLFFDTEDRIQKYQTDGMLETVVARFRSDLAASGYPPGWLSQVECHVGSKEVVDRDYEGSYYFFLR